MGFEPVPSNALVDHDPDPYGDCLLRLKVSALSVLCRRLHRLFGIH